MKIINKKTKEVFEIISVTSDYLGVLSVVVGNLKTKEIKIISGYDLTKKHIIEK
jgi:hypothetical protein